jgi:hypothetical protein
MGMRKKLGCMVGMSCMLAVAGCSPAVSAITKFQSGDIGAMTATEWESLADLGSSFGLPIPQVTSTQAKAIVDFLDANNIETTQQLETLLSSGQVTVPPELASLFN